MSRGGLKLEKAVADFDLGLEGKVCMDVGSSTGGFTDCMLQNGAVKVYAVDVGTRSAGLEASERSACGLHGENQYPLPDSGSDSMSLRPLRPLTCPFISLTKVLLPVRELLKRQRPGGGCLIKPQFEAGGKRSGKKGVVREKSTHLEVIQMVLTYAWSIGFDILALESPLFKGPEGNIEYLVWLQKRPGGGRGDFRPGENWRPICLRA